MFSQQLFYDHPACWYEISWNRNLSAITIRIHKNVLQEAVTNPSTDQLIVDRIYRQSPAYSREEIEASFNFNYLLENSNCKFGLGNILSAESEAGDNFAEFVGKLSGLHRDNSNKREEKIWVLAASFDYLLSLANKLKTKTDAPYPQLLTADLAAGGNPYPFPEINGIYSSKLVAWLSDRPQKRLCGVISAMEKAYRAIERRSQSNSFQAEIQKNGWLSLASPDGTWKLLPSYGLPSSVKISGYQVTSNKITTTQQQITLLAGLAALHDQARAELNHSKKVMRK